MKTKTITVFMKNVPKYIFRGVVEFEIIADDSKVEFLYIRNIDNVEYFIPYEITRGYLEKEE